MTTTAVLVEIIIVGYTAFIWIILFLIDKLSLSNLNNIKEFIPLITLFSMVIAYQIGWVIDYLSHMIFYYFLGGRKIKRKYIPDGKFFIRHNLICQKGSPEAQNTLKIELGIIRFSRSGIINFFLIGIALTLYLQSWIAWLPFIIISVGCIFILRNRMYHYYERLEMFYQLIKHYDEKL